MRIQVIFGVLLIYTHVVMGSQFQDHVVCTFNQMNPCYVAVGQQLHLQMPWEDRFELKTTSVILRYRKTQSSPPTPRLPRWQFVNDNKTMILTSAERNDSGTYTLEIIDVDGRSKGSSTLQVNIEGSLFQDHVCRFNQIKTCYVAVGQRLYLQMPLEDGFDLKTTSVILRYRKTHSSPPTPRLPGWQFVNDNKTMILTSAERSDSGTYTLLTFDVDGRSKGNYTLQVNIEAQVSSVKVSCSCLSSVVMKVNCSADGDNLHFSWTSDFNTLPQLENRTSTVTLEHDHHGNITCHVENNVSRDHDTIELHQCPGSLFQDHICRFNQIKPCYVAVGQRLHLQMPLEDAFDLKTTILILRYRKTQSSPPTPQLPRWQFVNDNKTMILTSAERSDSGTYTLFTYDVDGRSKGSSTLQVNIEAQVSSVKVSYSCLFSEVRKVNCSADGDNLHFSFTSAFNMLPQLKNKNSTVLLDKEDQGNITCHVENHVSHDHYTIELHQCPVSSSAQYNCGFMVFVSVWLLEIIILISLIVAFSIYTNIHRKQRITKNQESM